MKLVICAACKAELGRVHHTADAARLAVEHEPVCTASESEYRQAVIDIRFRRLMDWMDRDQMAHEEEEYE